MKHEKMHSKRDSFDDVNPFAWKSVIAGEATTSSDSHWKCPIPEDKNYIIKAVNGVFQVITCDIFLYLPELYLGNCSL